MDNPTFNVLDGLDQRRAGLHFAPIRHHSPACAWAVARMIDEIRPAHVLIEAPADLERHIPDLLDRATRPPVAIAVLLDRDAESRVSAYYPFCAHSPELIALIHGAKVGAKLRMIDLPSPRMEALHHTPPGRIAPLLNEKPFDGGTYIAALARRTGCRDGFELWDHLFETRLGTADWRAFFQAVGTYCAGMRAAAPRDDGAAPENLAREAHMAACIRTALKAGGPVVVVAGGFHVPALVDPGNPPDVPIREPIGTAQSYLIRYGFAAMDALSGYAAGLPQPAYYDDLWHAALARNGAPPWSDTALDLVSGFAQKMRRDGNAISLPAQTEMLRVADRLARMRGRPGALRHDLIDAALTALVKGETSHAEVWTERLLTFLRGNALGEVPPSAGSPPLVEDARRRAKAVRLDISDGMRRRRTLDIRRKASHLAASRFLHAMMLLEIGFASRDAGPDFVNGMRTDLLFEEWTYAWSPAVEARLVEAAVLGDDVPGACLGLLKRLRVEMAQTGESRDLDLLTTLFCRGLLAGLGAKLASFVATLADEIRIHGAFEAVAGCLRRLQHLSLSKGPMAIPDILDVTGLRDAAYHRMVYLCDDLPNTDPDAIDARVEALRMVLDILRGPGGETLDHTLFDDAIDRVARADPPPEILGAVLAICVQSGRQPADALVAAMVGNFHGSLPQIHDRIGVLRGLLAAVPSLLWIVSGLMEALDAFLCDLPEDDFIALLPHLRLALTVLNPRETDRVAQILAARHGGHGVSYLAETGFDEADLGRGLAAEQAVRASIAADGLADWLLEVPEETQ
ncbi:DUF5682 family protein [Actibacterium sp. 188UL27-1]|uniref:DUF5682 family protein n=1 Tax=Actibacterium sp. 188UL27-1 TaxID=2786961 RepID=UPI001958BAB9|nr:DUF5682 family protein [Actibacterium sp. 188UL27-1]MBM7070295.1 hypothetical protein [Actibacterium sp. 188UL27-1]